MGKRKNKYCLLGGLLSLGLSGAEASASEPPTLDTVRVSATADEQLGVAVSASAGTVSGKTWEARPLLRPAEVLEAVPGLIVSQHSGDGKANQYYLRGFNLDHGTDFATWVVGMPVNMPTHAHGQGYTDLNFLIPELIATVDYRKGPYRAEDGDFSAAGSARIDYRRSLAQDFIQLEGGAFHYGRVLAAGSRAWNDASGAPQLLGALELGYNDGPWTVAERLSKLNGVLRLSAGNVTNGWALTAMAYQAAWHGTDQVPRRAWADGSLGRFDSLDPSTGGRAQRASVSAEWASSDALGNSRASVYLIDNRLDLFSNFTYALDNPLRGDQFEQQDQRQVFGASASRSWFVTWDGKPVELSLGSQVRHDHIGQLGLFLSQARERYAQVRQDRVEQSALGLYGEAQVQWTDALRSVLGLRADQYRFDVHSDTALNSGRAEAFVAAPKVSLIAAPWARSELYFNYGHGFHSNDARGVTIRVNPDPRSADYRQTVEPVRPLVRARGIEVGLRSELRPGLSTTFSLWRLDLASELLFVGDAGSTEASRPSRRQGVEWNAVWQPAASWSVAADLAASSARFTDANPAGARIPGAVASVAGLAINVDPGGRWFGGLRVRHFGARSLVEDNSVRSAPSTLTNLKVAYRLDRKMSLALEALNLLNRRVSDIDYYYESQLKNESAPVGDIHTHPAEPRSWRLALRVGL